MYAIRGSRSEQAPKRHPRRYAGNPERSRELRFPRPHGSRLGQEGAAGRELLNPIVRDVRNVDGLIQVDRYPSRRLELPIRSSLRPPSPFQQQPSRGRELLHPVVFRISDIHCALAVHRDTCDPRELAVSQRRPGRTNIRL